MKHNLADGAYNNRVATAASVLGKLNAKTGKNIQKLSHYSLDELNAHKGDLTDEEYRRANYVLEENIRVGEMAAALQNSDWAKAKEIMTGIFFSKFFFEFDGHCHQKCGMATNFHLKKKFFQ